jgi:phytoene synthase
MASIDQKNVERIVKNSGSSFYWGMRCLPEKKKRAMYSIYAFCRTVDDIADDNRPINFKKKELDKWIKKINLLYKFTYQKDSLLKELQFSINEFGLEKKDFLSVIDGMKMDTKTKITFPSTKKLIAYCEKVAVAVGYLSIKIFEIEKISGKQYAYSLGMALQLTNIARDFKEDLEMGRCYLPHEKLKKYGLKKELTNLEKKKEVQDVLQDILRDAKNFFKQADRISKKIEKKKIVASEIMKKFYQTLHKKMYKKKLNFKKKVRLNIYDKISILISLIFR